MGILGTAFTAAAADTLINAGSTPEPVEAFVRHMSNVGNPTAFSGGPK